MAEEIRRTKQYKAICEQLETVTNNQERTELVSALVNDYLIVNDVEEVEVGLNIGSIIVTKYIDLIKHQGRLELLQQLESGEVDININ